MSEKGFSPIQAKLEAVRCLMCADAPCVCNCPSGVDARNFIRKIRFENLDGAVRSLKSANVLAASCSYICPTGSLCCKSCTAANLLYPIDISGLQRFVMDWERKVGMIEPKTPEKSGAKVAVIGSGPAGLGCAAELAVRGHAVTVFEQDAEPGGLLRTTIPAFRLPAEVVDFEIEFLRRLGIEFVCNHRITEPSKLLGEDFRAVFVATGLCKSKKGDLINADVPGVYQAMDILKMAKKNETPVLGRRVVVIGGGDTALDAARVAKRAGSECFILYRRTQGEMPAYKNEVDAAWNEGVEFYFRTIVRSITGTDAVKGVRCVRIRWHERVRGMDQGYDVEGTEFQVNCDSVILAMGQLPLDTFNLRTTPNGCVAVDKDKWATSETGIFAGGDVSLGGGTAARAVGAGKQAAVKIDEYLK